MKKKGLILSIILVCMIGLGMQNTQAQVIVKIKPVAPKVILKKSRKPYKNAVWIDGYWGWNKRTNRYVWKSGQWVKPKRNRTYVAGKWIKKSSGWLYVPGKWVRRKARA